MCLRLESVMERDWGESSTPWLDSGPACVPEKASAGATVGVAPVVVENAPARPFPFSRGAGLFSARVRIRAGDGFGAATAADSAPGVSGGGGRGWSASRGARIRFLSDPSYTGRRIRKGMGRVNIHFGQAHRGPPEPEGGRYRRLRRGSLARRTGSWRRLACDGSGEKLSRRVACYGFTIGVVVGV